jgi:MFS family permease
MCPVLAIEFTQHLDNGNLSLLGWIVAVAYVLGAVFCVRAGLVTQQHGRRHSNKEQPWWGLAAVLLFLGVNKWLDLQTVLIGLGRAASRTEGWPQSGRAVQVVFVVLFTLAILAAAIACLTKWGWFLKKHPGVCAGVALLFLFLVVRDATINHVDELLHVSLYDDSWGWILELLATTCFAWSAAHAKAS